MKKTLLVAALFLNIFVAVSSGQEETTNAVVAKWRELPGVKKRGWVKKWRTLPGYWKIRLNYDSPSNKRQIPVSVYVPPQYLSHPNARFPVLYTMQIFEGMFGAGRKFLRDHPMILVAWSSRHPAPGFRDGYDQGWWINSTRRPQCQLETFFFDELHPFVSKHFRTTEKVAATGFSSGGYAAHLYMLQKPEMFASVCGCDAPYFAAGYGGRMHSHISRWHGPYN